MTQHGFSQYISGVERSISQLPACANSVEQAAEILVGKMLAGGTAYFCGNGGSAADSQHLAAELMGRYLIDRDPLPAFALTVDTSALTAIANDYSYDDIFARQLRGAGREGDVLVAISTSGNSANVLRCVDVAKSLSIATIGLTGTDGGLLADACDTAVCVPSSQTNHIQEMHIMIGHYLCGCVEAAFNDSS